MKNNFGNLRNLLSSDFYKLSKMKSMIVAPIIMLLLILLQFAVYWWELSIINSADTGGIPMPFDITGKSMLFGASSYVSMGLFIAIICGIFIGGEFSTGTMKLMVARGSSRTKIYFSKLISIAFLAVAYTLFAFLISGILTAVKGYGQTFDGLQFGILTRSIVLQVLVNVSIASIFVMLSFLIRSQGSAIGISLAIYFLTSIILGVITVIFVMAGDDAQWLSELIKYIPSQQLVSACSYGKYSVPDLMRVIFVPIAYLLISSGIGVAAFLKRDVK